MRIPFKYNFRNVAVRRSNTFGTVGAIALVVAVFVAMMSLANGLKIALGGTGAPENVIVMRDGSRTEVESAIRKQSYQIIQTIPGIAKDAEGKPMVSAEVAVLVNLPRRGSGEPANVTVRGVSGAGVEMHPQVKLVEGRMFRKEIGEAIVSRMVAKRFATAGLGETIHLGRRNLTVVGLFDAGGTAFDSEIWSDAADVADAFDREDYSSVLVRSESVASRGELINRIAAEQRLKVQATPEVDYYAEQTSAAEPIRALGIFVAIIMGIGACFGAMNTMYAAVAQRTREIAMLRALGFSKGGILFGFVIESMTISLVAGVVGCLIALPVNGIATGTMNVRTFSEIAFSFRITPDLVVLALVFSLLLGLVGGFLPSRLAARLPITKGLRQV